MSLASHSRLDDADPRNQTRRRTLRQHWDRLVRHLVWRMDIDPTAWIANTAYIDRTWPKGIHIGRGCIVDHEASILTHDMTRGIYLDTWVEEGCVIGTRAIVMPGVRVGAGCRVDPGAVVTKDVPPGCRVRGNPATIV